jgi:hypothetical protein
MYERVGTWPLAWRQHVFDKAFGLDPQRRDPGAEPGRVVELLSQVPFGGSDASRLDR